MARSLPWKGLGLLALVLLGEAFAACFPSLEGLAGSGGAPPAAAETAATTSTAATSATATTGTRATSSTGSTSTATTSTATTSGAGGCGAGVAQDPHNCGACGHDCLGGACDAGRCQPFVFMSGQQRPIRDLTAHDTAIYWATGSAVMRWPEDGQGLPMTIGQGGAIQLAVGSGFVYFLTAAGTQVFRAPLDGGAAAQVLTSGPFLRGLVVDAASVYLTAADKSLYRASLADLDAGLVAFAATPSETFPIAVDGVNVYAGSYFGLVAAPKDQAGGPASRLSDSATQPDVHRQHLAVDGESVAWAVEDGGAARYSLVPPNGLASPLLVSPSVVVRGIAAEVGHVYVTEEGGTVAEVASDGGAPEVLAQSQDGADLIAVSATALYWVTHPAGQPDDTIVKLAK